MTDLPILDSRYGSAWNEHCTRITARQNILQIYTASASIMFGFYFYKENPNDKICLFLMIGITFLTCVCSAFIWLHQRVMQNLLNFMKDCEQIASRRDNVTASGRAYQFYFGKKDEPTAVANFHADQRLKQRLITSITLTIVNAGAIWLPLEQVAKDQGYEWIIICSVILTAVTILTYIDLYRDKHHPGANKAE